MTDVGTETEKEEEEEEEKEEGLAMVRIPERYIILYEK